MSFAIVFFHMFSFWVIISTLASCNIYITSITTISGGSYDTNITRPTKLGSQREFLSHHQGYAQHDLLLIFGVCAVSRRYNRWSMRTIQIF